MILSDETKADLEWELVRRRLDNLLARGILQVENPAKDRGVQELHLELTHRCNLKCVMCEHWEIEHVDPASVGRELDLARIRAMVSGSRLLDGVKSIAITGGEPWLRTDFVDIVALLAERFPQASIIVLSNFWNTGHIRLKLRELKARGVDLRLGSSLDGLEATHDRIRGQKGSFAGIVETVKMMRAEFPEIPFGFTFTITPDNARELFETYEFVKKELGCGLGAQWVIDRPGVKPMRWTDDAREAGLRGIRRVLQSLCREHDAVSLVSSKQAVRENSWLWSELLYWQYLEEYGREPRRFDFFKRCLAGERHVMVDPEGEVFFCPVNRERTIGNAAREPLDALWTSKKAEQEREFVESCKCHCWLRCMSVPVLDRVVELGLPKAP